MNETFRLDLNQLWEAIDIKTGHAISIPKGSHQAIRMLIEGPQDPREENYLVVTVQHKGIPVLAGLREANWRRRVSSSYKSPDIQPPPQVVVLPRLLMGHHNLIFDPDLSLFNHLVPCHINPHSHTFSITHRVRRKRHRLPSNGVIESA